MTHPILNRPEVQMVLFHPRREPPGYGMPDVQRISVEVGQGVSIGGRLYPARPESPTFLYFHGNGEIAADYDDLAPLYTQLNITLLVMDYRGYGTSTGTPTAANLLADAVTVSKTLRRIFQENDLASSHFFVMGRSLGSAAAIEVAQNNPEDLAGLIIESGFADTFALLARLGIRVQGANEDRDGFSNLSKIGQVSRRTLIIHGEEDELIPPSDGQALYAHSASGDKRLLLIPGAGHNDIMMVGTSQYFGAIREFVSHA
jgi:fermentation-respiration switch protein FrsA (DUF1100 family)